MSGIEQQTFKLSPTDKRVDQLGEAIQEAVFPRLLEKATTKLMADEPVSFGTIKLTNAGLSDGRRTLPWEHFSSIRFWDGMVCIGDDRKRWGDWRCSHPLTYR